jgi:hypothetical protein
VVAAERAQPVPDRGLLDALRDDGEAEVAAQRDGGPDDRGVLLVLVHAQHEGLVDLELVDGQVL